jgi:hypothetical protein
MFVNLSMLQDRGTDKFFQTVFPQLGITVKFSRFERPIASGKIFNSIEIAH